jgi:ADP-heptose:LPS heptosyltransferase
MSSQLKRSAKSIGWAGAGLLFSSWGLLRDRPHGRSVPDLREVRSILAIRLDLMGDLLFTLPAIAALREAAPQARLSLLVLPYTAEIAAMVPGVDRVVAVDVNSWRRPGSWANGSAPRQVRAAMSVLRSEPYDLAVSFYGRVGAAAALLSGARYIAGYRDEGYFSGFDLALEGRRYLERKHEAEYCLDLVRAIGAPATGGMQSLKLDPGALERIDNILMRLGAGAGDRLVALHPGALNMAAKRWLPERWAEVADRVQRQSGCRVVLVGSPSELPLVEQVRGGMETQPIVVAGRTTLTELAALLGRCPLFLGGDSGPLHLASALGVPSVSVYGATDPATNGPLGARARVVRAGEACSPCYDLNSPAECRRGDILCMHSVTTDQLWPVVMEMLSSV